MDRSEIYGRLTGVFRDVFDDDTLTINDTTTANDIEDWDSLTHISLLTSVEDEFGVKFDMKAVLSLQNVGEMVDLIAKSV